MATKLITPPATDPISLAEAKAHMRVDHSDDDALISRLIRAATGYVDASSGWLGRALVTQTWDLVVDAFPLPSTSCCCPAVVSSSGMSAAAIELPYPPLQSVTSIKYFDVNGDEQTMPTTDYVVDTVSEPGWVVPTTAWPSVLSAINAVSIRFVAGYGSVATSVPEEIRQALLLLIGHYYDNREQVIAQPEGSATVLTLPFGFDNLLSAKRIMRV